MLLASITSKQWADWLAFYAIDPWGDWREDRRTALLGSMIAAGHGKRIDPEELMLYDPMAARRKAERAKAKVVQLRGWFERKAAAKG